MLTTDLQQVAAFKEPKREIVGGVFVYEGSTVSQTLLPEETLVSIAIDRVAPSGKFFGFAIAQKLTIEVLGEISLAKGTKLKPYIGVRDAEPAPAPYFYVSEVQVTETKNKSTIVAFDTLGKGDEMTADDLTFTYPITLSSFADVVCSAVGGTLVANFTDINPEYAENTINLGGTETVKSIFSSIAEVTGTICYCSYDNNIVFKKLPTTIVDELDSESYFEFSTKDAATLAKVGSGNSLNDSYVVGAGEGYSQMLWNNPFLDLRDDRASLLETLAAQVIGTTIIPFDWTWRGNPFYEIGDYIKVTSPKGEVKQLYMLNESISYKGGLRTVSNWEAPDKEDVTGAPTSLGKLIKQTTATVDKVNNKIELLASKTDDLEQQIASIDIAPDEIKAEVEQIRDYTNASIDSINENMNTLTEKVSQTITAENVIIAVEQALSDGVDSVTTKTGFTFDAEGLTIDKSGTEMSTQITEDGMTVYRDSTALLVADHIGVKAMNLHATTYLTVGRYSRFEDYGDERTGCFWIGI